MTEAKDKLNKSALAIENAQNDIRLLIQRAYLYNYARVYTEKALKSIIESALKSIDIPRLKRDTVLSLTNYANRQKNAWKNSGITPALLFFIAKRINASGEPDKKVLTERLPNTEIQRDIERLTGKSVETVNKGVPLQRFYGEIWKEKIKPTLSKIAAEKALDPNDYTGRNSLRNLAEMEVRYQGHKDEIEELKASGEKLVLCSTHADCSERCAPYQGRLYSLDGTSGEIDGIKYVPLEYATNNPRDRYTTKAGRTYQNGLLGFNCFDKETEVYTNRGWKRFYELDGTEMFYTLDKETRETEWQAAKRYYKLESQREMIHFKSNTVDLLVTPNHNMLYFTCRDKRLRFSQACDLPKTAILYGGEEYDEKDIKTVKLGEKEVDGDLYCKLMAYYLSDGSIHNSNAIKIAQTNNETMYKELQKLPFKVWRDKNKIVIYGKTLVKEMKPFGVCTEKFIPRTIFEMSRRQINVFLEAYLKTDGYTAKNTVINGYNRKPHLQVFTTSKRLADGLSELALKAGYRPKVEQRKPSEKEILFPNGIYKSKLILYVIHLNRSVNAGNLKRERVRYNDFVYCVEVPNHTLLVRRNGRIIWCGNCRHKLTPYRGQTPEYVSESERKKEYSITQTQRAMERRVRALKAEAEMTKHAKSKEYIKYRKMAKQAYEEYKRYSKENERAYYPMRVSI